MSETIQPKIMISAGEASGDKLGAHLASAIKQQQPGAVLYGMGGDNMKAAGVDIVVDCEKVSVVGIIEVFTHLSDILATRKTLIRLLKTNPPDLLILIDLPDFNLNLAKHARKAGIKVLYYVSPQIWAWRYGRIKQIKKTVDHLAVLFEFEKTLYDAENVPATFVGHPLTETIQADMTPHEAYRTFQFDSDKPIVALLPGSRRSEITRLMPILMETAKRIKQALPDVQFALPLAPNLEPRSIKAYLTDDIHVVENNFHNVLSICNAAVTASGTATLEVALHQIPLVVIYKVSRLSYLIGKCLIKTPYIALCNIVAQEKLACELIQQDANPEAITSEVLRLLNDTAYRQTKLTQLKQLKTKTGEPGAAERTASVALQLLDKR